MVTARLIFNFVLPLLFSNGFFIVGRLFFDDWWPIRGAMVPGVC